MKVHKKHYVRSQLKINKKIERDNCCSEPSLEHELWWMNNCFGSNKNTSNYL